MPYLVPYNWRQVKTSFGPTIDQIRLRGCNRKLTQSEVPLKLDPRTDITELREWLADNAKNRFAMFGIYRIIKSKWELRGEYEGVVFSFHDIKDAIYFKLAWYNNEPSVKDC